MSKGFTLYRARHLFKEVPDDAELRAVLDKLDKLDFRAKEMICSCFVLAGYQKKPREVIALEMRISPERMRQIETLGLDRIRVEPLELWDRAWACTDRHCQALKSASPTNPVQRK